jgi:hypothetical protein
MSDEFTEGDKLTIQRATATDPDTRFNLDCNKIFLQGEERFGDFESVAEKLKKTGAGNREVLEQLLGTNDPAKIMYSTDEETLTTIAKMPPVQRASAIAAIERGEPLPTGNPLPSWKRPRNDLSREDISDKAWSAAWDRKYLGKGR